MFSYTQQPPFSPGIDFNPADYRPVKNGLCFTACEGNGFSRKEDSNDEKHPRHVLGIDALEIRRQPNTRSRREVSNAAGSILGCYCVAHSPQVC